MILRECRTQSLTGFSLFGILSILAYHWPEVVGRAVCVVGGLIAVVNFAGWCWMSAGPSQKEPSR